MSTFLLLSKFSNEYEFLARRLKYYHYIENKLGLTIYNHVLIESHFWSGKVNNINLKTLEEFKKKYPRFKYTIINHIPSHVINISRRCREEMSNCFLTSLLQKQINTDFIFIFSDLDEIIDTNGFQSLIYEKQNNCNHYNVPYFLMQRTIWFTTKFVYNEQWCGPVAYLRIPNLGISTLTQSTRHLPDKRTYIINSGFHLSFLKSSIISKSNNSHGLRYFNLRLFIALISIHPFRRKYKAVSYKSLSPDQIQLLGFFEELSFKFTDLFAYLKAIYPKS